MYFFLYLYLFFSNGTLLYFLNMWGVFFLKFFILWFLLLLFIVMSTFSFNSSLFYINCVSFFYKFCVTIRRFSFAMFFSVLTSFWYSKITFFFFLTYLLLLLIFGIKIFCFSFSVFRYSNDFDFSNMFCHRVWFLKVINYSISNHLHKNVDKVEAATSSLATAAEVCKNVPIVSNDLFSSYLYSRLLKIGYKNLAVDVNRCSSFSSKTPLLLSDGTSVNSVGTVKFTVDYSDRSYYFKYGIYIHPNKQQCYLVNNNFPRDHPNSGSVMLKLSSSSDFNYGNNYQIGEKPFFSCNDTTLIKPQYVSTTVPVSDVNLYNNLSPDEKALERIILSLSKKSAEFEKSCNTAAGNMVDGYVQSTLDFSRFSVVYKETNIVHPTLISQRPVISVPLTQFGGDFNPVSLSRQILRGKNMHVLEVKSAITTSIGNIVSFSTKTKKEKESSLILVTDSTISKRLEILDSLKKQHSIYVDDFLKKMLQHGVIFFLITLNTSFLENKTDTQCWSPDAECGTYFNFLETFIKEKLSNVAFCSVSDELNANGYPCYHIFLGIENILNSTYTLKTNIINTFLRYRTFVTLTDFNNKLFTGIFRDVLVKECLTFLQIFNAYKKVTKGLFKSGVGNFIKIFLNVTFLKFSSDENRCIFTFLRFFYDCSSSFFFMTIDQSNMDPGGFDLKDLSNQSIPVVFKKGTLSYLNCLSYETFIYIFKLYFKKNGFFTYNKDIYTISNFFGCTRLSSSDLVFDVESYYIKICDWCLKNYPLFFKDFPFNYLKLLYLKRFKNDFEKEPGCFLESYKVVWDFMVFRDGVYIIDSNFFLPIDYIRLSCYYYRMINDSTYDFQDFLSWVSDFFVHVPPVLLKNRYFYLYNLLKNGCRGFFVFSSSFNYLRYHKKKPYFWLKTLEEHLVDKSQLADLVYDLSKYFNHEKFDFKKNNLVTVIDGPSNSLKTSLIGYLIKSSFGLSNIGVIFKSDNFAFQDLINKKMIFVNNYSMCFDTITTLLDISSGEGTKVQAELKNPVLLDKVLPILFITMDFDKQLENLKGYNIEFYNALINRFQIFKFKRVNRTQKEFDLISSEIKKEFPLILLYCFDTFRKRKLNILKQK